jgi:hypothetical protein
VVRLVSVRLRVVVRVFGRMLVRILVVVPFVPHPSSQYRSRSRRILAAA